MTGALLIQARKEVRALAPWWAGIVVTVLGATFLALGSPGHGLFPMAMLLAHVAGCAALGALSIGHEFSSRTLGQLLALPVDRRVLFGLKTIVAAAFIGLLFLASYGVLAANRGFPVYRAHNAMLAYVYAPAIAGLALAPLLTMLCRGPLAGAVFAIALPALGASFAAAFDIGFRTGWRVFTGVAVAGFALSWLVFQRLSIVDGPAAVENPMRLFNRPMPRVDDTNARSTTGGWVRQLLAKELRLQLMTFVVSGLFVAIWAIFTIARITDPHSVYTGSYVMSGFHGVVIAVIAGAVAAAEERHLGAREWQVLQPVPSSRQWMLKACVALVVALALAIGLPLLLQAIEPAPDDQAFEWIQVLGVVALTSAGLYISSISSTGLRAALASLPLIIGFLLVAAILLDPFARAVRQDARSAAEWLVSATTMTSRTAILLKGAAGALAALVFCGFLIRLGLVNYRSADRPRSVVVRQLFGVVLLGLAVSIVFGAVDAIYDAARSTRFGR
jgi:hypothetical protein